MKKSNFIMEKIFKMNLNYVRLQNKSKELFFKDLDNNIEFKQFKAELEELWDNIDHSYLQDDLTEFEAFIHENNVGAELEIKHENYIPLIPLIMILKTNDKFVRVKEREYKNALKSYAYKTDKQDYLKLKVSQYNNQVVPYYSRTTGELLRYVQPSTYNSMIQNTNLTRTGWNTTLNDADLLRDVSFYIPYHNFSCIYCAQYQGRLLSKSEVLNFISGELEEQEGDILHPNCKCVLTIYNDNIIPTRPQINEAEIEEQYNIRQKVNTLTLRKEEVLSDMKIQKGLGNQDEVDKLNQKRNKINSQIRELVNQLPTEELRKQVVAINR